MVRTQVVIVDDIVSLFVMDIVRMTSSVVLVMDIVFYNKVAFKNPLIEPTQVILSSTSSVVRPEGKLNIIVLHKPRFWMFEERW